jgi:hypothetical protein
VNNFAATSDTEFRQRALQETAAQLNIPVALVEKDFWVCWTLKQLFSIPEIKDHLIFKGGTTLSKVYGIIHRFSEDIDLTIDRRAFAFDRDLEESDISNKERKRRTQAMVSACATYVQGPFRDHLCQRISQVLGTAGDKLDWELVFETDQADCQNLLLRYPIFTATDPYVRPEVKIELGSRSDFWPSEQAQISPFVVTRFPALFEAPMSRVTSLTPERTFWEKATILHDETCRPAAKAQPPRYSRHYYDLVMLARSAVKAKALDDLDLLARVTEHKHLFFRYGYSDYASAKPGSFRLLPDPHRLAELRKDYAAMQIMMFPQPSAPSFEDILAELATLESDINALAKH